MRIAVTGAAGHLGTHLCQRLVELGYDDLIRVDLTDLPPGPGEARQANLAEAGAATKVLAGADRIVHIASIHPWKSYPDDLYLDLNVKGTWHVYQAARELGVKQVVLTSSIAAEGYAFAPETWPVTEDRTGQPGDLYSLTKHAQEDIARLFAHSHQVATLALRPPAFMPKPPLETGAGLLGCFALVEDIAEAHAKAVLCESWPGGFEALYVVLPQPYVAADAELLSDCWALAERYHPGVTAWFAARGAQRFWVPAVHSIEKARRMLGWEPRCTFDWWWQTQRPTVG